MEKQQDNLLMKPRSYRNVIAAGFRLYTENFRRLFKASWLMVLLYALCCGATSTLTAVLFTKLSFTMSLSILTAAFLLAYLTQTLAMATILAKLKEHKDTGTISIPARWLSVSRQMMLRTLKASLACLLCSIVLLVLFPLILPLFHVFMKYLMEPSRKFWATLKNYYGKGLRHWGFIFLVMLISGLIVCLAELVITLPSLILSLANQTAQAGVLMGDPLGMPSYIHLLTFVTGALCSFMGFYVCLPILFHTYYIYGSIETQEQEREQQKLDIQ